MKRLRPENILLLVFWSSWVAATGPVELDRLIDAIAEANVTEHWQVSEAMIADLPEDLLAQASQRQRERITLIAARNTSLGGRWAEAIADLEDVRASPYPDHRAHAYSLSANIALLSGDYENGFLFLRQALELLDGSQDHVIRSRVYGMASYAMLMVGESEQAMRYGQLALEEADVSGDLRSICYQGQHAAEAKIELGLHEAALAVLDGILPTCRESGDPVIISVALADVGRVALHQGDADLAMEQLEAAIDYGRRGGYREGLLKARFFLAEAKWRARQVPKARSLLDLLLPELEEVSSPSLLSQAYRLRALIAEADGELELALDHQRRAEGLARKVTDRERSMRLAYLQTEFDFRRQEQELKLLREQARVAELEALRQRDWRRLRWAAYALGLIVVFVMARMLLQTRRERGHFRSLAQRDSLTGLYNHSNFFRRFDEVNASEGAGRDRVCLLLADIDYFKHYNDAHGHPVGDQALQRVAELLNEVFGHQAIIGRIGGEEFAVLMFDCTLVDIEEKVARLRTRLEAKDTDLPVLSMSFGLVQAPPGWRPETVRQAADDALYRAKRAGRNRLVIGSLAGHA